MSFGGVPVIRSKLSTLKFLDEFVDPSLRVEVPLEPGDGLRKTENRRAVILAASHAVDLLTDPEALLRVSTCGDCRWLFLDTGPQPEPPMVRRCRLRQTGPDSQRRQYHRHRT